MTEVSERKRVWGWYFFDWASQPYHTLLMTFIFSPFFVAVAAENYIGTGLDEQAAKAQGQALWGWGTGLAGIVIALGAPFMGALADTSGRRRPWIALFSIMYVVGATLLWFTAVDGSKLYLILSLFAVGFIGAEYALIFINSQLPGLVKDEAVGETSGNGFAFGYLGGVIALAIVLVFFAEMPGGKTFVGLDPGLGLLDAEMMEGTRAVGPLVAIWFVVFMIPYFLWVRDGAPTGNRATMGDAMAQLKQSIAKLKERRSLLNFLLGSMFYRDGLNGMYAFGGIYAVTVLDWTVPQVGVFGIVAALASVVFCWLGGKVDSRIGPKPVIVASVWVLIGVSILLVNMSRDALFGMPLAEGSGIPDITLYLCGVLIGGMGGIVQSSSRSLMVRHTDPVTPTENFGLYGLSGRATAFLAPFLIAAVTTWTGSARLGVSPVILLFVLGLILLRWVNAKGDQETWAEKVFS